MLRPEALVHFCKALCTEAFSAKRQVEQSPPTPLCYCTTSPAAFTVLTWRVREKQFSGWGAWEWGKKVYFFAEEGGLEGWRHSNCHHTSVSGICHLLPPHRETVNCLPRTASSLPIPAGLEQGRPHTSNSAAPPPVRTWLSYYKNPGKSHHHKSIWPPLSGMWKINNQSYQARNGQHWRAKLQRQRGGGGRQNKNFTTEGKIKLCQSLGMTSRKNALVRIMVGGCWDIPKGSSKTLSGMSFALTTQPICLHSDEYLHYTLTSQGWSTSCFTCTAEDHGGELMLPLSWQIRSG